VKCLNLFLSLFFPFLSLSGFAQTPLQIETDLVSSFRKISYCAEKHDDAHVGNADDLFAKKLKSYAGKFPATMSYPFSQLKQESLTILTSADGLFRSYSWDDETGGTMRYFEHVCQYKSQTKIEAIGGEPRPEGEVWPGYEGLYTFKTQGNTYYLAITVEIGSSKDLEKGIQVFSIENGKLNADTKIIKTKSGLHSKITYDYDLSRTSEKVKSEIHFDPNNLSIYVPVVLESGRLTTNYIAYKFTGQYFERVKN
jgi:hypothetical protein